MKRSNYIVLSILALAAAWMAGCSPRVDDIFDESAIERLTSNNATVKERLIAAPNGWVMQYFPRTNNTASDSAQHQGYTFLMQFRQDGSVTVAAPFDGAYRTATSHWDVVNDNSTVLTFNTFNYIFHYYSNPDPDLNLTGDGVGVGGDYEFLVLTYDEKDKCQELKGKKNGTYNYMYALKDGQDWPSYFKDIEKMDSTLFGALSNTTPLDMYAQGKHFTLFNARKHEFRAFEYGADTLGSGSYYGFLVTPDGIRFHDDHVLEELISNAPFLLNDKKDRLVSTALSDIYITIDAVEAFRSDLNHNKEWLATADQLSAETQTWIHNIEAGVLSRLKSSKVEIQSIGWTRKSATALTMNINWTSTNKSGKTTSYKDNVNCTYSIQDSRLTLSPDSTNIKSMNVYKYSGTAQSDVVSLVKSFNGTFTMELVQGFAPAKGIRLSDTEDREKSFVVKH